MVTAGDFKNGITLEMDNAIWQVIGGKLIEMYTVVIISVNAVVTIQFIHIRIFLARSNYHGKHE